MSIDWVVGVFLVRDNKVLLSRNSDCWFCIGGHIKPNEDPIQAAIRETNEKIGIDLVLWSSQSADNRCRFLCLPDGMDIHKVPGQEDHQHICLYYFSQLCQYGKPLAKEGQELGWFSFDQVQKLDMYETMRTFALRALEEYKNYALLDTDKTG